jgi:FKBP-type peptidyl-prolyl cis-trans isomerase (trigger factor)
LPVPRRSERFRLPELDEEFLKHFGFESAQELRDYMRNDIESRIGEEVRENLHGQACQYLLDRVSLELPERLSSRLVERVTARRLFELYEKGVPTAEVEKVMDQLKTSAREQANITAVSAIKGSTSAMTLKKPMPLL